MFFQAEIFLQHSGVRFWSDNQSLALTQPPSSVVRSETLLTGMEDLRPCMAFSNLDTFVFGIGWNADLNDSDLLTLASSWPRLQHLFTNEFFGWNSPSGITPNGSLQVLQRFLSLYVIVLAVDTRGHTESACRPA